MQKRTQDLATILRDEGVEVCIAVGGHADSDVFEDAATHLPQFSPRLAGGHNFVLGLRRLIKDFEPDIVHGRGLRLAIALRLAAGRTPATIAAAGMPGEDVGRASRYLRLSQLSVNAIGPGPVAQLKSCGINATLLPNAFTPAPKAADRRELCSSLGFDPDAPLAVAAGRFVPQKDPLGMLAVLAHAERWNLAICGDGPMQEELETEIKAAGLEERVRLLGWRQDARSIVGAADALLFTSRWEGQGGILVEAMAAGVPIVSTACPGVVEWVTDEVSGLLAPMGDFVALAAGLDRLIDDPVVREKIIAGGKREAQPHIGASAAKSYLAYYEGLLHHRTDGKRFALRNRFRSFPRWQTGVSRGIARLSARSGWFRPSLTRSIQFWVARLLGQPLSLKRWNSMTFNDKVVFRQLRVRDPRFTTFNDKLAMRGIVSEQVGENHLPYVFATARCARDLAGYQGPFVLKGNHGSGYVIIVREARTLTPAELDTAQSWLGENFGSSRRELGYEAVEPSLFLEELLSDPSPVDYKFFCFSGVPKAILVCFDRMAGLRRVLMSTEWEVLGGMQEFPTGDVPHRPTNFGKMLELAERLSAGIDFLRVDLYDMEDRVLVGELTPYPLAGRQRFAPESLDGLFGSWWHELPKDSGHSLPKARTMRERS